MNAHGQHIFLDFTGYEAPVAEDGAWMLDELLRAIAAEAWQLGKEMLGHTKKSCEKN